MKIKYQNGNVEILNLLKQVNSSELKDNIMRSDTEFKKLLEQNLLKTNVRNNRIKGVYVTNEKSHKHYVVLRENNIAEIFVCGWGRVLISHDIVNVVQG